MRHLLPITILLTGLLPSCGALLGVGAGVAISQEVIDNDSYVAQVNYDADIVWATVKSLLSHESKDILEIDEDLRKAKAKIDGGTVMIGVELYDLNRSVVRVSARKYAVSNGELAELMLSKVLNQLEKNGS